MLKVGDSAQEFKALDHTRNEVMLADLKGHKVWLWFFSSPGGGN
jgi:peroxiredoxin